MHFNISLEFGTENIKPFAITAEICVKDIKSYSKKKQPLFSKIAKNFGALLQKNSFTSLFIFFAEKWMISVYIRINIPETSFKKLENAKEKCYTSRSGWQKKQTKRKWKEADIHLFLINLNYFCKMETFFREDSYSFSTLVAETLVSSILNLLVIAEDHIVNN